MNIRNDNMPFRTLARISHQLLKNAEPMSSKGGLMRASKAKPRPRAGRELGNRVSPHRRGFGNAPNLIFPCAGAVLPEPGFLYHLPGCEKSGLARMFHTPSVHRAVRLRKRTAMRARSGLGIALLGAWVAGLALAALVVSPAALSAAVIDDFNGDQPGWTLWNPPAAPSDPAALAELANNRLRIATQFTTATDPANPVPHLCNVYYSANLPVQQGKTLELRAELASANLADNLFSCLVTVDIKGGEYVLMWDRTEVGLFKWSQSEGFSVAFWETHSSAYYDVVLALALTPEGDDLLIEAKVTRRVNAQSVYQRTVRDTPGSDWGVPDPLPRGWQIFGPDAGAPYKDDLKGVGVGVLHDTDGQQATAIVQFDNLEYRTFAPIQDFYVIDDFEQGRQFMLFGTGGQSEWEIVDGQLNLSLPQANTYGALIYKRLYDLPEDQPVEFRLDLVSVNAGDVYGVLVVDFTGQAPPQPTDRGYELAVFQDRVLLVKLWDSQDAILFNQTLASMNDPKTMSLTFTREGDSLRIDTKVALRDDPQTVILSRTVIDSPGADFGGDNGPPPAGPVTTVIFGCGRGTSQAGAKAVVDSLVCSADQVPGVLGIRREGASEVTLTWPGWNIALESDSVHGPWRPCSEPLELGDGEYISTVPLGQAARYFRLARGYHVFDSFKGGNRWNWATTSVAPTGGPRAGWAPQTAQSRGRILGAGVNNEDFMLRSLSLVYRDCVAAVDIIDWGQAMEDATFGILLRARPEVALWHNNIPGLPDQRYAGLLTFKKADNPAESALSITGPGGEVLREERFPAVNPEKQYRLRFWAVGDQLTIELFDRDDLDAPLKTFTVTDGRIPDGMDALYGTKSAGGTYEVIIDQYMLSGVALY